MAEKKLKGWPHIPETEEERDARLRAVARKVKERFGSVNQSERRCPQCAKKMILEYAESPNESEPGIWVQSCWGCGYESHL
jgi:uncharacterized protein with PIN domain